MITVFLQLNLRLVESRMGNERISNILWCLGIVLATLLLKRPLSLLLAKVSSGIAHRFSDRRHGKLFQQLTVKPLELLLQTFLYYIAINQLSIFLNFVIFRRLHTNRLVEIHISDVADKAFLFLLILFFILVVSRIADFIFYVLIEKANEEDNREKEQLFPLVKEVAKIVVWTIGLFWILGSVFDVNIPALITGLGIGGVAIALAAKESVENLFAAFTILTDKPFQTSDAIKLGAIEGTVERIGFRSTRLRNTDGSLYIIPNKKLVGENVENLTQRDSRRIRVVFNLKYDIGSGKLESLIQELKQMIRQTPHVAEPVGVMLETFGENTFQLSASYFVPTLTGSVVSADDIRQQINLRAYNIIAGYTANAPGPTTENEKPDDLPENEPEDKKDEDGITPI